MSANMRRAAEYLGLASPQHQEGYSTADGTHSTLLVCDVCGAAVPSAQQAKHTDWHRAIDRR